MTETREVLATGLYAGHRVRIFARHGPWLYIEWGRIAEPYGQWAPAAAVNDVQKRRQHRRY